MNNALKRVFNIDIETCGYYGGAVLQNHRGKQTFKTEVFSCIEGLVFGRKRQFNKIASMACSNFRVYPDRFATGGNGSKAPVHPDSANVCSEYIPDVESSKFRIMLWPLTGMKLPVRRMKPNRLDIAQTGPSDHLLI
jgi:hypothetical protein